MGRERKYKTPRYTELIIPVYDALLELDGSGTNQEIYERIVCDLNLPEDILEESHLGSVNQSELEYQLAWARTYLKAFGVITNSSRSVWSIEPKYTKKVELDPKEIVDYTVKKNKLRRTEAHASSSNADLPEDDDLTNDEVEYPEEIRPWRKRLAEILQSMDPYAFERLAQRVLRESGFSSVKVTRKSGDGGIDGTGKLKINGMVSFYVAFQCKRYKGSVGPGEIRDFRGSLTTDVEKGIFITTGTYSRAAREEAITPGKKIIDLIDLDELLDKIAELGIGVKEVKTYEIDDTFFENI